MSTYSFNPSELSQSVTNWAVAQRIVGSFAPHAQVAPGMKIIVDPGHLFAGTTLTEVDTQVVGPFARPASGFRIDRVVIDRLSGEASVVAGSPNSVTPPNIPDGALPVARVFVQDTASAITDADIVDERALSDLKQVTSGNVVCRANLNGVEQPIPRQVWTKVNLAAASLDIGGAFHAATNSFRPSVAGLYEIYAQTNMIVQPNGSLAVAIQKNGVMTSTSNVSAPSPYSLAAVCMDVVELNGTSDYVQMAAHQNNPSTTNLLSMSYGTFMIAKRIG
ncbi:hypothetical protein FBZ85_105201 [Azospirillum brasilense]|uniref:Uncharacterized protein n=1 Tax=Azospirillum baldaniorum TaxID=1064539 RepID=A0A9P1JPD6_9PROT|nr:hypothetical protein [Azospirillum baldaniorum]TWA78896.1 hypothetical protein FBZ85_105201 [Azospirillum brasilense]CCC97117.1 protein of unknown function [Azospirillum baldaniorum]